MRRNPFCPSVEPSWPIEAVAVPAEADPAQAPRVAENDLVGKVRLELGHGRGARLADQPGAVGRETTGHVHPANASNSSVDCMMRPCRADRARQIPHRRRHALAVGTGDVTGRDGVAERVVRERDGASEPERYREALVDRCPPTCRR